MTAAPDTALAAVRAVICDIDGVVVRGATSIPGAAAALERLRAAGKAIGFLTNNSTKTPAEYADWFHQLGINCRVEQVMTSGLATARALAKRFPGGRVMVVGGESFESLLRDAGLLVVAPEMDAGPVAAVAVGLDRDLTYWKLAAAQRAVLNGARLIASNADSTFPTERGLEPGAGVIVAALERATGVTAEVIGKPKPQMLFDLLEQLGASLPETLMVGDRLETDIRMAKEAGVRSCLVLTGISDRAAADGACDTPDLILESLADLPALLVPALETPA